MTNPSFNSGRDINDSPVTHSYEQYMEGSEGAFDNGPLAYSEYMEGSEGAFDNGPLTYSEYMEGSEGAFE